MPKNGAPTRTRILDAAEALVIDHGYAATSVDDVIAASASSKGAFFHHFASKQALADALVERYVAADLEMLDSGLAAARAAGPDPAVRAVAFLDHFVGLADGLMGEQSGCLYAAVLTERQLLTSQTSAPIATAIRAWRDGFAALLREALPAGSPIDVDDVADHVFVTFEGAFLLARSTEDPSHLRRQLGVLRALVETALAAGPQERR